jgi:hypothetical protein
MNQTQYTIKQVLKDNFVKYTQTNFFNKRYLFRKEVFENVFKIINCKEGLGHSVYHCPNHPEYIKYIPFTCKSRSCPSCGVKATNNWSDKINNSFPNKPVFHITYTIPDDLHKFFLNNRKYLKFLLKSAGEAMISWFSDKNYGIPAVTCVLHTAGSKLNWHPHVHMIISCGSLKDNKWLVRSSIPQAVIHKRFKAILLKYIKPFLDISNRDLLSIYSKCWYCFIKKVENLKVTINYISRYIKHPPIGQSRITHYNKSFISFVYKDYREDITKELTCPVSDFISLFIYHIPKKFQKYVMHFGLLANRVVKYFNLVLKRLGLLPKQILPFNFRNSLLRFSGNDPLLCPHCHSLLDFLSFEFSSNFFFPSSLFFFFNLSS